MFYLIHKNIYKKTIHYFSNTLKLIQSDYQRLRPDVPLPSLLDIYIESFRNKGFGSIIVFRFISERNKSNFKIPLLNTLLNIFIRQSKNIELNYSAQIGPGLLIYHSNGIVIGSGVVAGKNLTIEHNVTVGNRTASSTANPSVFPILGDNCFLGCGSCILGPIHIGNNVKIGCNTVILKNLPDNSTAVGNLSFRVITQRNGL